MSLVKKSRAVFSPLFLFLCLGYLSLHHLTAPRLPSHHVSYLNDTKKTTFTGTVAGNAVFDGRRTRFVFDAETGKIENRVILPTGKIRVTAFGDASHLNRGDRIEFTAKPKSISNFNNPGGFDYKRYMVFKKIMTTAYVKKNGIRLLKPASPNQWSFILSTTRRRIARLIDDQCDGDENGVLKALIIGSKHAVSPDLRDRFARAGISHLLAISGLHIGITASVFFFLFSRFFSWFTFFLWKAWTKKAAALFSLIPVTTYALISGMSPSTQRAVIMVGLFLATFLIEREQDLINTLAAAAMLILAIAPQSLFSASFQLSFAAVFFIIYGLTCFQSSPDHNTTSPKPTFFIFLKRKAVSFFLVSWAALLGTLPLVMFYFNQVSIIGWASNFVFVPVIGFVVVPLGLLSVFLYPFSSFGASLGIGLAARITEKCLILIDGIASLPFAAIKTFTPTRFESACFYLLLLTVLTMIGNRRGKAGYPTGCSEKPPPSGPGPDDASPAGRPLISRLIKIGSHIPLTKTGTVVFFLLIGLVLGDVLYWVRHRFFHNDLRITILDVGRGNCALLELPKGKSVLIDGGGFYDNKVFDIGARVVAPFLWRKKIMTVDMLILTHPNSDHLNGLLYIAKHFHVKKIWTNGEPARTKGYAELLEIVRTEHIDMPLFKNIPSVSNINDVVFNVLYPPEDFLKRKGRDKWRNTNNNSMVVKIEKNGVSVLFPGDIMKKAEQELVRLQGERLQSTYLVAPHHGSKSSGTTLFLQAVRPKGIIISSKKTSSFIHPHPTVLKRYERLPADIFRTDKNGAITLVIDDGSVHIKTKIPFEKKKTIR